MTASIIPSIHLTNVYNLLIDTYGEMHNDPDYDPLGGLVGTILSQHTSDINSGRAYRKLVDTFPTWEEVRDAPTELVADAIRSGGWLTSKLRASRTSSTPSPTSKTRRKAAKPWANISPTNSKI
ncbi:hypothetical protein [Dictyobacter kobayashii]|uniref:HhH-GPD domain-containing protein n=1 Tax=Dictyobacter kobayashii TaxID=2014872 RepID=A0A402APJ1_9CHLR|nr:hypothetical protein [Dictyobacter kobayashii]GCE20945.1 hypothetical protein KDK_47450 [Dictyobacter kobayashii]